MALGDLSEVALPAPVAGFVRAVNAGDLDALVEAFGNHAMVNDQLREYWGKPAIREWAEREVIAQALTMRVTKVVANHDLRAVEARIDGNFDKRGLPDPLLVSFYFSMHGDEIAQLVILRNEPGY
jgi:hypothetical protein